MNTQTKNDVIGIDMEDDAVLDKYRPIPFWSWNEKLDTEETGAQTEMMKEAGIGGYIMHARGGLETEYMSEEWFDNIKTGIDQGKKLHMTAWVYDENGWPSGFGNGKVNGKGLEYQQKYLRMVKGEKNTETTICNCKGYHFYYEVNSYYVDTLDAKVTKAFLEEIYDPYYERFGDTFDGVFTDEPQVSRNGIPWSFVLEEEYQKAYGEGLKEKLLELFLPEDTYVKTRFQFWKLITDLFSRNYTKQIYDWCQERNLKFTGHLACEDSLTSQITCNGACMPGYEYFDMPGMDWLGREISGNLIQIQLCSVAHQLGKKQILTETFALCGHNVSFEELKGILEWQMIRGVNVFCTHLQGYSIRGIRKRDYPPALFYQQPWWNDYKVFIDAMTRTGMILGEGSVVYNTLVIHPEALAWVLYDNNTYSGLSELEKQFNEIIQILDEKHILFHLGDETIMERHAKVEGSNLIIGTQTYSHVILLSSDVMFDATRALLEEYKNNGGRLTDLFENYKDQSLTLEEKIQRRNSEDVIKRILENLEGNDIIDNKNITYTNRIYPEGKVHYFVNTHNREEYAFINRGSMVLDALTGETRNFEGYHKFEPYGSLIVLEEKDDVKREDINSNWTIESISENALTLDFCDYYFDGELIEANGYVLNIQNRACALERPVHIKQIFKVEAEYIPQNIFLACETPEIFEIIINGHKVTHKHAGYFIDEKIRKLDITDYMKSGVNVIEFHTLFEQPKDIYENLKKARLFESEKNKLTYHMEIEPIYLVGDFDVKTEGSYMEMERDAVRYSGSFVIVEPKKSVNLNNLHTQGYPFFCGTMVLSKEVAAKKEAAYRIRFDKKGINVVKLRINDGKEQVFLWGEKEIRLQEELKEGKNKVSLTLTNNLRNLMGPHHLKEGESYGVGPHSFFKESCIWTSNAEETWNSDYCFVKTGIKIVASYSSLEID